MRQIGEAINKKQALIFSDYLISQGIENKLLDEPDTPDIMEIWALSDDRLQEAEELFNQFRANPEAPEYAKAAAEGKILRKQAAREAQEESVHIDARTTLSNRSAPGGRGPITSMLVLISIVTFALTQFGKNPTILSPLLITDVLASGHQLSWMPGLPEIMRGEIWRLFTPIFIHFSVLHILFNMLWLHDLGNMIENRKGSIFLFIFVCVAACSGNVAQYFFSHPYFGGMSGINYGLFGYIWMKSKYDPNAGLFLHSTTVVMMLIWYFLGFTPLLGNIANATHTAGLVAGVVWGYLSSPAILKKKRHFKE